ncbi:hypothetical protein BJV82DRAFT_627875 [Fennellomyces sp. T-0311]|nr:hypothetical protein BJV82DRAFT_627875 [Fennellomyces sp. T-0311]
MIWVGIIWSVMQHLVPTHEHRLVLAHCKSQKRKRKQSLGTLLLLSLLFFHHFIDTSIRLAVIISCVCLVVASLECVCRRKYMMHCASGRHLFPKAKNSTL